MPFDGTPRPDPRPDRPPVWTPQPLACLPGRPLLGIEAVEWGHFLVALGAGLALFGAGSLLFLAM